MADISNVINVSILEEPSLAARDNLNIVSIITSETGVLTTAERYRLYSNIGDVATDWGTSSQVYSHAQAFFGTSPNPIGAGGMLVVGWWRATEETVAATAAVLTGAELSEAIIVAQMQAVSDGQMHIDVDGTDIYLEDVDFRTVTSIDDIATILQTELGAGVVVTVGGDNEIIITSATTGATSTITLVDNEEDGAPS